MKIIPPIHKPAEAPGFTCWDLLAILATLALLTGLAYPALANHKTGSDRATCLANLRQIGTAFLTWGNAHGDRRPFRVPVPDGTQVAPKTGNGFLEFFFLRNQIDDPRILACPADTKATPASFWVGPINSVQQLGGNAISYFVGLDASPLLPQTFLSGDANMVTGPATSACSSGVQNATVVRNDTEWTNSVHGLVGNLLLNDGSAHHLSSEGLRKAVEDTGDLNLHTLFDRK